jgi:hypothetical protein
LRVIKDQEALGEKVEDINKLWKDLQEFSSMKNKEEDGFEKPPAEDESNTKV